MKGLLFSVLITLLPSISARADGVRILQKYQEGHRYKQQVTVTQESSVSTGVTNSTTKTNLAIDLETIALPRPGAASKSTLLSVRYARISMSVDRDGTVSRYEVGGAEPIASGPMRTVIGVLGRGFNIALDPDGNVESVSDYEQAIGGMAGSSPLSAGPFREMFNAAAIKRIFEQSQLKMPKGQLATIGETWPYSHELALPALGKLLVTGSHKFERMAEFDGKPCAEISVNAVIGMEPPGRATLDLQDNDRFDTLSQQMRLKMDGSAMTGTIYYDPEIAFPRSVSMSQNVLIEAKIPDGTKNMIRMPIKQTITVKLADFGPVKAAPAEESDVDSQ
jgi:hypothetical protein